VLYDSDAAGQKASAKAIEIFSAEELRVRVAAVPEGKDPDTLLKSAGPAAVQKAAQAGLTPLEYRIHTIEKEHTPESEEFWALAVAAIAAEPSEMERLRFIEDLAPRYPRIHDAQAARNALLRQVQKVQTGGRAVVQHDGTPMGAKERSPLRSMLGPEITLFRAMLEEEFRPKIWLLFQDENFLSTAPARKLAQEIVISFPNGMPKGPARRWLEQVGHPRAKDLLVSAEQDFRGAGLTAEVVSDSIQALEIKRSQRELEELKRTDDDDRLKKINEKLKREKGG
jgi:DNA primase